VSISANFQNHYSETRRHVIYDTADQNAPVEIFSANLEKDGETGMLSLSTYDGSYGRVLYQRSDGPQQIVDNISDQSTVSMN